MEDKEFAPYQESFELKELGFDEPCLAYWFNETPTNPQGQCIVYYKKPWDNEKIVKGVIREYCSAPTFSQAFRWFRKKYGIFTSIVPNKYGSLDSFIGWIYVPSNGTTKDINVGDRKGFSTPEEAELACLRKLIEIVKNK